MSFIIDDIALVAPAPNTVNGTGAQTVGQPGIRQVWYWIVAHYPIGVSISGPFLVRDAPQVLSVTNYVRIVWEPSIGALKYDVLRTDSGKLPNVPALIELANGITQTKWLDQGQVPTLYDVTALQWGAPVQCHVHLNNRDYDKPTMELPCQIKVTTIVFDDGSTQDTAGGGGGSVGPPGPAGPAGPQGATGATGATGAQGPAGPVGPQGSMGTTGAQGPPGPQGPQGLTGPAGARGATGPQGMQGVPGAIGPQGPIGATGGTGAQGPQGPMGAPGTSTIIKGSVDTAANLPTSGVQVGDGWITDDTGHLWVWTGTGWVDAGKIVGPQGPQGPAGPTGPQGGVGNTGPPGPSGSQGPTGATGAQGSQGPQGPTGPPGPIVPATKTTIGAVIVGDNINVLPNGTISVVGPFTQSVDFGGQNILNANNVNTNCVVLQPSIGPMYICLDANANMQFSDRALTGRMWLTQAGRLGVNTNAPAFPVDIVFPHPDDYVLRVLNPNNFTGVIIEHSDPIGGESIISFRSAGLETAVIAYDADEDAVIIWTGGKDAGMSTLCCDTNSRVGILTTSPAYELDVNGDVNTNGVYRVTPGAGNPGLVVSGANSGIRLERSDGAPGLFANFSYGAGGAVDFDQAIRTTGGVFGNTYFSLSTSSLTIGFAQMSALVAGVTTGDTNYLFDTSSPSTNGHLFDIRNAGASKVSVDYLGNVGIGLGSISATHQLELSQDDAAKPTTNTWTITSDARTKRHSRRFEGDIEVIRRLEPTVAEYNGKCGTPKGGRVVSFEAEKLREILPQAVSIVRGKIEPGDKEETEILGINTHEIFFHMLRAIQQIDARLLQLESNKKNRKA